MSDMRRDVLPSLSSRKGLRPKSPAEALEPGRAPNRPRGMRRRREPRALSGLVKVVSGVLTIVLVFMAFAGGVTLLLRHLFDQPGPLEAARVITIPKGEGRIEIAERLEQEGAIASRWVFLASHLTQSWFGPKSLELKAGEYEVKKGASMREVLDMLVEGKSAVLYKLTIPEGLTSQQIVERVNGEPALSGQVAAIPAEGSLFPDTYRFSKGTDRQELVELMKAKQQQFLDGVWDKRQQGLPIESKDKALILASLIERETGRPDERGRVAAVFVNRLKKAMRLQSDPTIVYGIVGGAGPLGRAITRADIDKKTPYNTYQNDGLPPGPICNPGRSAIESALNPAKTNDLYFVADGNGGHVFSATLKDHNAAVATWRKLEKDMKAKQEAQTKQDPKQGGTATGAETAAANADTIPNPPAEAPAGDTEAAPATPLTAPPAEAKASSLPLPVRKPKQ